MKLEMYFPKVVDYLIPHKRSCWRWAQKGETLVWRRWRNDEQWIDAGTIAFLPELQACVDLLAPDGLPRCDAIVFALAACARSWKDNGRAYLNHIVGGLSLEHTSIAPLSDQIKDLMDGLDNLHNFMQEHRHSFNMQDKAELVTLVLEASGTYLGQEESDLVVKKLHEECPDEALTDMPTQADFSGLAEGLMQLAAGLANVDFDSLQMRMRSGLDALPAGHESAPLPRAADLLPVLDTLRSDPDQAGLVAVFDHVRAVMQLPRRLDSTAHLTEGGVCDLSNRGDPERLLLSELANDDDVLLTRLALREALYTEREQPRRPSCQHRRIVMESSIRMWGSVRLFAATIALALGLDAKGSLRWWRVAGDQLTALDLSNPDELRAMLEHLDIDPLPIADIPLQTDQTETVLILHARTFTDPNASAWLADQQAEFVITVDGEGNCSLLRRGQSGFIALRQACIDINEIGDAKHPVLNVPERAISSTYFMQAPLRVALPPNLQLSQETESGALVSLTAKGHLLYYDVQSFCPRLLGRLPHSPDLRWLPAISGTYIVAGGFYSSSTLLQVLIVDMNHDHAARTISIEDPATPLAMAIHNNHLLLTYSNAVKLYSLPDGQLKQCQNMETIDACYDGIHIRRKGFWSRMQVERRPKLTVGLYAIPTTYNSTQAIVGMVAQWPVGHRDPQTVAIHSNGHISSGERNWQPHGANLKDYDDIRWLTPRGELAGMRCIHGRYSQAIVDLRAKGGHKSVHLGSHTHMSMLSPAMVELLPKRYPQRRIHLRSAGVSDDGVLVVTDRNLDLLFLDLQHQAPIWRSGSRHRPDLNTKMFPFGEVADSSIKELGLSLAIIDDDLQVYLDPLGLLHIRRPSQAQRWLTVGLNDGETAIAMDGKCTGRITLCLANPQPGLAQDARSFLRGQ